MNTTIVKTEETSVTPSELIQKQVEKQFGSKKRYLYEHSVAYCGWLIVPLHAEHDRWKVIFLDPEGQDMTTPYPDESYDTMQGAIEVGKATLHLWAAALEAGT